MLSIEEFTAIASAESEEERQILCGIHDISYETFLRLWPIERFGRYVLAGNIRLLNVEHVFQANPTYFDPEDKGPGMSHSLLITYIASEFSAKSASLRYLNPEYHENRIEVNWLEVTPSLEKAIHEALTSRRE